MIDSAFEADLDGSVVTLLGVVGEWDKGYKQIDRKWLLSKVFQALREREKQIIFYAFYKQKSQKETGEELGISQMYVSRLQRRALEKLKKVIHMELSEEFCSGDGLFFLLALDKREGDCS